MDCPKCGSSEGWSKPTYSYVFVGYGGLDDRINERLEFTCLTCGYVRYEPTKDAVERIGLTDLTTGKGYYKDLPIYYKDLPLK